MLLPVKKVEVGAQSLRESKVLESVYPYSSSILSRLGFFFSFVWSVNEIKLVLVMSQVLTVFLTYSHFLLCSPTVSVEAEAELLCDSLVPIIPIIPTGEIENNVPPQNIELPPSVPEAHKISVAKLDHPQATVMPFYRLDRAETPTPDPVPLRFHFQEQ